MKSTIQDSFQAFVKKEHTKRLNINPIATLDDFEAWFNTLGIEEVSDLIEAWHYTV